MYKKISSYVAITFFLLLIKLSYAEEDYRNKTHISIEEIQNKKLNNYSSDQIIFDEKNEKLKNIKFIEGQPSEILGKSFLNLNLEKTESPQMETASSIVVPFARKEPEGIVINKNNNSKKNTMKFKFIDKLEKKENNVFSDNGIISDSEINTLIFPSKILKVLQPIRQNREIIYLNDNKAMSFYFNKKHAKKVQFIVSLQNGKIISLRFRLGNVPGRVMYISSSIEDKKDEYIEKNSPERMINYSDSIIGLMRSVAKNDFENKGWVKIIEANPRNNLSNKFTVTTYRRWVNSHKKLEEWSICSKSHKVMFVRFPLINTRNIEAWTAMDEEIYPGKCTKIYSLSAYDAHVENINGH